MSGEKVKVAVNGYVVIGKRVADAVAPQDDMQLVGVADVATGELRRGAQSRLGAGGVVQHHAVWEDALASDDREIYLTFQVHNEAIVVPETVDCIRALTGIETDGAASIAKTDQSLGITKTFLAATTKPIAHVTDADIANPGIAAVRATHARFAEVGFKGSEEQTDTPSP